MTYIKKQRRFVRFIDLFCNLYSSNQLSYIMEGDFENDTKFQLHFLRKNQFSSLKKFLSPFDMIM